MSNGKTLLTLGDDRERLSGYAQIRVFEGDCDRAQAQIRTAASTWILAGLGGLFVAYSEHRPGQLSSELLSAVVCLLAVSGIAILWTVDQRVYQKLLHAAFVYGLAVEAQNPDLPQIRTMMNLTSGNIGPFISFPDYELSSASKLEYKTRTCGCSAGLSDGAQQGPIPEGPQ